MTGSADAVTRRERLEELTLGLADGELTDAQAEELDALLEDEDLAALHGLLLEQEAALRGEGDVDVVERTLLAIESHGRVEKRVLGAIAAERSPTSLAGFFRFAVAAALVLAVGFGGTAAWIWRWHAPPQEALVFGLRTLEPGAPAHVQVLVRHAVTLAPYADTAVRLALSSSDGAEVLSAAGQTDAHGVAVFEETVPASLAEGTYSLRIVAETRGYTPVVTRPVTVRRGYRIYVTTDKPRYQPGQTIRMRALAMTESGLVPAGGRDLVFRVKDAKGNLVFESTQKTSAHGLCFADLELAEQVNMGRYAVSAAIGDVASERAVAVEHYVLPKLKLALSAEKAFYAPGDTIHGTVKATYTFGEPVDSAAVEVAVRDATSEVVMANATVTKGTEGLWRYAVTLPARFGAVDPNGDARVAIEAQVKDDAGFANGSRIERVVSPQTLLVDVVVPGGRLAWGVANPVYLSFRSPDGTPAAASGTLGGEAFVADDSGIAEVRLTPELGSVVALVAQGDGGATVRRDVLLNVESGLVLQSDQRIYEGGATMKLEVRATHSRGTVFVDAVQGARTLWTRAVELGEAGAELAFDVPADVHGAVRLRALRANERGELERSDRIVLVRGRTALSLAATFDRESYRPGETAKLKIAVTREGRPTPAAVSLAGVDEAVFALSETRPGMQQAYFELNRDLIGEKPLYPLERVMSLEGEARERAAGAALSRMAPVEDQLALFGSDSYRSRDFAVSSQRSAWLEILLAGALAVPGLAGLWLMLWLVGRGVRSAWRRKSALFGDDDREAFVKRMRWFVFAWVGGVVLPAWGWLVGLLLARSDGAAVGSAIGAVSAWGLMYSTLRFTALESLLVRAPALARDLKLVWWSYAATVVGVAGVTLAVALRVCPKEALAVLCVALYGAWALSAGSIAAAGAGVALARGRRHTLWMFLSRAGAAGLPLVASVATSFVFRASDAVMTAAEPPTVTAQATATPASVAARPPTRVRSEFPETLLWEPQLITDEQGHVELDVPLADSITTWRLSMSAVSSAGALGAAEQGLRVFQPFFIEPELPVALTQNDVVTVPVAVFNYLDDTQSVTVTLANAEWLTIDGPASRSVTLQPREVKAVSFRVKADKAGEQRLRVEAAANDIGDAVERVVTVRPDGERVEAVASGELKTSVSLDVTIPDDAIAGSEDLVLKIYPGALSQVAEGMEGVFRMPSGCFEQTSSVTYPSLLVLDYLRQNDRLSPELRATAERFIQLGYQRLLSFEVPGGGFEWFGKTPAHPVLTAYGLMEFHDMRRVQVVDEAMIARTQAWLLAQQRADGLFSIASEGIAEGATRGYQGRDVRTTAYIAWALAESGVTDPRLEKALAALVVAESDDSYTTALIANALVAARQPGANAALARVVAGNEDDHWRSQSEGVTYGGGEALDIETTALSAYVLLRSKTEVGVAQRALAWLSSKRDPNGTWSSTQATVAAMRALLAGATASTVTRDLEVAVSVEGEVVEKIAITPASADVFRLVSLRASVRKGARRVTLASSGGGTLAYQLVSTAYRPWPKRDDARPLALDVRYSATDVKVFDEVIAEVTLHNRRDTAADMTMLDLGTIPGLALDTTSLDTLVASAAIERYEARGGRIRLYLRRLPAKEQVKLSVRYVAERPVVVQTPPARAYPYYEPSVRDETAPVSLTVR